MRLAKKSCIYIAFVSMILTIFCLCSCSNYSEEGFAAKVDGVGISEDIITEYIQNFRQTNALESNEDWKSYLAQQQLNVKDLRDTLVDNYIEEELFKTIANENNIVISDADVQDQIEGVKSNYPNEEEFQSALAQSGETYEQFIEDIQKQVLSVKVQELILDQAECPTDTLNKFLLSISDKLDGSKGYRSLKFPKTDSAKANEYLAKIKSGQMTFEEANKEVVDNDKQGLNYKYVMYSCFDQLTDSCSKAINSLNVGDISEIIESEDGSLCIYQIVDDVSCGSPINAQTLPEKTLEYLKEYAKIQDSQNLYTKEIAKIKSKHEIIKYDMPKDLPYA